MNDKKVNTESVNSMKKECEKKGVSKDFIRGKIEGVAILLMSIDLLTFDKPLTIIDRIY